MVNGEQSDLNELEFQGSESQHKNPADFTFGTHKIKQILMYQDLFSLALSSTSLLYSGHQEYWDWYILLL